MLLKSGLLLTEVNGWLGILQGLEHGHILPVDPLDLLLPGCMVEGDLSWIWSW